MSLLKNYELKTSFSNLKSKKTKKEMFKTSVSSVSSLSNNEVAEWLKTIDAVFTDCDGTLWHDNNPIPGAVETINTLQSRGKRVYFVTNNGTRTRHELWQRAHSMGFAIAEEQIIAPTYSIVEYLKSHNFQQQVYVIGSAALTQELDAAGIRNFGVGPDVIAGKLGDYIEREVASRYQSDDVGAVVIGWDEHFSYGKMMKASNYLGQNGACLFLSTNTDAVHRYPHFCIPGTGAILSAVETCVARTALQLGKPNPVVCAHLLAAGVVLPKRTLMIGDCCKIDVTFGKNCGFQTLLVGTGSYQLEQLRKMVENTLENRPHIPDVYLPKLGDLLQFLQ